MRICLDWDNMPKKYAIMICNILYEDEPLLNKIELYRSPMKKGFHVYLYLDEEYDFEDCLKIRRFLGDDPKRIKMDKVRGFQSILFQEKYINGKIYREIPIRIWQK